MPSKRSMFLCPLMALALTAAALMGPEVAHAADPPTVAASSAIVEADQVADAVATRTTKDYVIGLIAAVGALAFVLWRSRVWTRDSDDSSSPGRPNKQPLEPYRRE